MKKYIVALIVGLSMLSLSYGQYPTSFYLNNFHAPYKEVYNRFYESYDIPDGTRIYFQKKPEGWYVLSEVNGERKDLEKFWSFQTQKYYELSFKKKSEDRTNNQFNSYSVDAYNYEKNLFYGYKEWSKDVIHTLGTQQTLPDDFLNSLARAYANEAGAILAPYSSFQSGSNKFDVSYDNSVFTEEELNSFEELVYKDIETYERIYKQNPQYETFVGNVRLKIWDEYMYAYNCLMMVGLHNRAQKFLQVDLFDPFFISVGKALLNSCEPNGILIVGGDNDTYPLIYVQDKFNYRPDVIVINSSLANMGRYINYLVKEKKLKTTLQAKDYNPTRNEILFVNDDSREKIKDIKSMLSEIAQGKLIYAMGEDSTLTQLTAGNIEIDTKKFSSTTLPAKKFKKLSSIKIGTTYDYHWKSWLLFLDIVYTNNWQRPLYVSNTVSFSDATIRAFVPYFILEGINYRIVPYETLEYRENGKKVNTVKGKEYFEKKFDIQGIDEKFIHFSGKSSFVNVYKSSLGTTASEMIKEGKSAEALKLLDTTLSKIPTAFVPWDYEGIEIARIYFDLNQKEKGLRICKDLIQKEGLSFNSVHSKYADAEGKIESFDVLNDNDRITVYIYYNLKMLAEQYSLEQLKSELEKYPLKYSFDF